MKLLYVKTIMTNHLNTVQLKLLKNEPVLGPSIALHFLKKRNLNLFTVLFIPIKKRVQS